MSMASRRKQRSTLKRYRYGFSIGSEFNLLSASKRQAYWADIYAMGARWVRIDASWTTIQYNGPAYWNWITLDAVVAEAVAAKLQVLLIPQYAPPWACPRIRRARCRMCLRRTTKTFRIMQILWRRASSGMALWVYWRMKFGTSPTTRIFGPTAQPLPIRTPSATSSFFSAHILQPKTVIMPASLSPAEWHRATAPTRVLFRRATIYHRYINMGARIILMQSVTILIRILRCHPIPSRGATGQL